LRLIKGIPTLGDGGERDREAAAVLAQRSLRLPDLLPDELGHDGARLGAYQGAETRGEQGQA